MLCLYCGEQIPSGTSRALGNFCSVGHRAGYYRRSLQRSGLSRDLAGFRSFAPTIEVIGADAAHPYKIASSGHTLPGVWHLSSTRARGIPSIAQFSRKLAERGLIKPRAGRSSAFASPPIHTRTYILPALPENSWSSQGQQVLPQEAFAGVPPRQAIPPVRIWDRAGMLRIERDVAFMRGDGPAFSLLKGLEQKPEREIVPSVQVVRSNFRPSELARRPLRRPLKPVLRTYSAAPQAPEAPGVDDRWILSIPEAAVPRRDLEIQVPKSAGLLRADHTAFSKLELSFIAGVSLGMEAARWKSVRPARLESTDPGASQFDTWQRSSFANGEGPLQAAAHLPSIEKPVRLPATPRQIESLPNEDPIGRIWLRVRSTHGLERILLASGVPAAAMRPVDGGYATPRPLAAILEGLLPNERQGIFHFSGGISLDFSCSWPDSAGKGMEPRTVAYGMLAIAPDSIPEPRPAPASSDRRLGAAIPDFAGRAEFTALTANRVSSTPHSGLVEAEVHNQPREKTFSPIRSNPRGISGLRTALGEAGPVTKQIHQVPDIQAIPAVPKKLAPRRPAVIEPELAVGSRMAPFAGTALEALAPRAGQIAGAGESFKLKATKPADSVGAGRREEPVEAAPAHAGFAEILPAQATWSTVLARFEERTFNPILKTSPQAQFYPLGLRAGTPAVPPSKSAVPFDFRWQRDRKPWDRAARWKMAPRSVHLPDVTKEGGLKASLEEVVDDSLPV